MSSPSSKSSPSPDYKVIRWLLTLFFLVSIFGAIFYGINGVRPPNEVREVEVYTPWSEEVIEAASVIPVQDNGRVKPFATYARFRMLSMYGAKAMKIKVGKKVHTVSSVEWLLDCLFRPELAHDFPIFRVDDTDILKQFGLQAENRRDRLSYNEITGDLGDETNTRLGDISNKLIEIQTKAREYGKDSLSETEKKTAQFGQNLLEYVSLIRSFDFAREKIEVAIPPKTEEEELEVEKISFSQMVEKWNGLQALLVDVGAEKMKLTDTSPEQIRIRQQLPEFIFAIVNQLDFYFRFANRGPHILPPYEKESEEWHSVGVRGLEVTDTRREDMSQYLEDLRMFETLAAAAQSGSNKTFLTEITKVKDELRSRSSARQEGLKIETEVSYYQKNWFMNGLVTFVIAFLLSAVGWIVRTGKPGKILHWATIAFFCLASLLVIIGLVHRYLITGRPPVSYLYDTIPFITAIAIIVLGLSELMTRRRILLSVACAFGVIGLFFAFRYEVSDAKDNMDPLRAVLDSNYWLATHVVTISIGYCGGLVACFLSIVYVFLALAGVMEDPKQFQRFMTRTVYGITCFTLLFSLVGTILGGIWANDSWGRFWGWDPKENGALLIVLWTLIILHARLSGWIKSWGLHFMSILGGSVVVFSWWGVNMLGIGLHSYGFIEGADTVWYVYGATLIAFVVGVIAKYLPDSQPH